uniref:class I SAM-dependent methyltransferase n=1 Tax=Algoriphagus sp. TaxID=1872435 RepID=UPI004047C6F2
MATERNLKVELKKHLLELFDSNTGVLKREYSEEIKFCPVCGSNSSKIFCKKDGFVHNQCEKCSMVYLSPRLTVDATHDFYNSVVNEAYNDTKFHDDSSGNMDDQLNLFNFSLLQKYVKNPKKLKLLEIGPGRGAFLKKASIEGFHTTAVELNSKLIDNLSKFCDEVYTEDLTKINLIENSYDVIYFRDVIEHIPNPKIFLKEIYRILKKEGILIIDTHNIEALIFKLTKEYHTVIFGFEHPLHWSPKTLKLACESVGLNHVNSHFQEFDLSLYNYLNYLNHPSFTFINPPVRNSFASKLTKSLQKILDFKYISVLNNYLTNASHKYTRNGSKMQLVFTKR